MHINYQEAVSIFQCPQTYFMQVYLRTGLLPHINAGVMTEDDLLRWGTKL